MSEPPFMTAIIDPPWPYDRSSNNKKLSGYVDKKTKEGYLTEMSIDQIAELRIGDVVSRYIFMWTAGPFLAKGLRLLDEWDFEYKTQLVWYKKPGLGVGYWFRGDHELILVAKRKGFPSVRTNERSLFISKRIGHSEKPPFLHELIERHFPSPFIELFGRRSRPGWTVLGNQAPGDGHDIKKSLELVLENPNPPKFNSPHKANTQSSRQGGLFHKKEKHD